MVPLVGGGWAEAKTRTVGTVVASAAGPRAGDLSSLSRLADHLTFSRLATVATHRRGGETAGTVVRVVDGAEWCQGVLVHHRPDAVRVLDDPHAVGSLATAAAATYGAETAAAMVWLAWQALHRKAGETARVLLALAQLPTAQAADAAVGATAQATAVGYLGPGWSRCATPASGRPATRSAAGRGRAATRWSSRGA